jgi:PAS domain S-box-containing protein
MKGAFPLDVEVLLSVLNHLNLGVYVTDLDRNIMLWNRKAEEITGYRAADVVGRPCRDQVLTHIDKEGHRLCSTELCPLYRSMQVGKPSQEPVLVYAKKADGMRVAVSVSVAPLRDESGGIVGGIEAFSDESERIYDLEFARKIQENLLPESLPEPPNMRFDVRYYPHDLIGGDFYDVRSIGPGRYGILVADVRGHGVSASLYTMWLKSLTESHRQAAQDPAEFLSALNHELSRFVVTESFATAFYAVVDCERCEVVYANAGHPLPLRFRADGSIAARLEAHGVPLGITGDVDYSAVTTPLHEGDLLVCYTDGATEVRDRHGRMLGEEGLARLVSEELGRGDGDLLERVYRQVTEICADVSLPDDFLLLSVRRTA